MSENVVAFQPKYPYCAKIRRFAEAFWVVVEGELYGTVYGRVDNGLGTDKLKYGDFICFQREEILEETPLIIESKSLTGFTSSQTSHP